METNLWHNIVNLKFLLTNLQLCKNNIHVPTNNMGKHFNSHKFPKSSSVDDTILLFA